MTVYKDIQKQKNKLIQRANTKGIYENFGQREVRQLEDKYIDLSDYSLEMMLVRDALRSFDNWCTNYTGGES